MALFAISHSSNQMGGPWDCGQCQLTKTYKKRVKRMRCRETGWREREGNKIPVSGFPGIEFSFCPGKVAREAPETVSIYRVLMTSLATGTLPEPGAVEDQSELWTELLTEFSQVKKTFEDQKKQEAMMAMFGGAGQ